MSAAFTPGPWQVYVSKEFGRAIHIAQGDNAAYTPHASDVAYQTVCCDPTAVQMANARLIATAPKLLDACRKALYALKGREHDQFLRDVIAEATGEQA